MLSSIAWLGLLPSVTAVALAPPQHLFSRAVDPLTKRATCTPTSRGVASQDDVPAIEAAFKSCGTGGIIRIPAGNTYMIRTVLDFTGCADCDFQIEGTLKASDDVAFWAAFPSIISVSGIQTAKIRSLTGSGTIDGNGQAAWDAFAQDSTVKRPKLLIISGRSKNIAVSNLSLKNPPTFFILNQGESSHVSFDSLTLTSASKSKFPAKNTDGIDIGGSTYTTLKNITISNQEDCVAFKPGANYATVSGIHCKGSHGISLGSMGGTTGRTDTIQNIYVTNAVMEGATKAVGIKLWPGGADHGFSVIKNVTWDGVTITNCDYAAQIQSCYASDASYCSANPARAQITDVYFKNFKGGTSTKHSPTITNINCPDAGTCDLFFSGWSVSPPSGTARYLCNNIDTTPGVTCVAGASG